jgi:hypothetical protein
MLQSKGLTSQSVSFVGGHIWPNLNQLGNRIGGLALVSKITPKVASEDAELSWGFLGRIAEIICPPRSIVTLPLASPSRMHSTITSFWVLLLLASVPMVTRSQCIMGGTTFDCSALSLTAVPTAIPTNTTQL